MSRIQVLIADDHRIVREGLRALLLDEPDIELCGEARSGEEVLERCAAAPPDVVIMDIAMPDMDGIEATRRLMARQPGARVIILSMYDDPASVSAALRA